MPVEPPFKISSFCNVGGCVGVALGSDAVAVTSTRIAEAPVLSFGPERWASFVDGLRSDDVHRDA